MKRFLIDANLPRNIPAWRGERFQFVVDIDDEWSDSEIWNYARKNAYTIVTKDADFSNRIIVSEPPPKIIHIKVGNLKLRAFERFIEENWTSIEAASKSHKLVNVYPDRIESIE
ncbi:MAG: DUF5615 family PIN-like protein [Pyrinomonadaceae bacterium]|nr:DUF5615 family PIN-like protein [Pyrinomonadaceae bacterium]